MNQEQHLVALFFRAMQAGAAAEADMEALFAFDAVYVEPFSGAPRTHTGRAAIMAAMREGWTDPLPDMTISMDRVDVAGDEIVVAWTCRSPALPGGAGRGVNRFTLRDGKIRRLETSVG
jgi:ketosteroid isomerase-like protein